MKWILPTLGLAVVGFGLSASSPKPILGGVTVIISGGARGHLSPCGCTKPMSGGMLRLATIIRQEKAKGPVVWIDTGDIIDTPGRQSQMKAETYSELMGTLGVDTVAYTNHDRQQGVGLLVAGTALSKKKWLTPLDDDPNTEILSQAKGLTVSAFDESSLSLKPEAASDIALFDGPKSKVRAGVDHQLIAFASDGIPTISNNQVSPGSNFRGVVIAKFVDNRLQGTRVELLDASIKEDPQAEKIYRTYLSRVTQERLIDGVTRESDADYAGSNNCRSCHTKIVQQYEKTKHAHAYNSLIKIGHQADPDCVSCHVTGLNSTKGFYYEKTRNLGQVSCESCHGAARSHARNPRVVHLPKVTEKQCLTCHTPSNSATFNFPTYWKKIKH